MLVKRILEGQEKIDTLRAELEFLPVGTTLDSKIRCKLCGHEFFYKDAFARELLDVAGHYELINCKFFPKCDGGIQDFEILQ